MPQANRTEKRKQQTRQKIIHTAVRLFQVQGFQATTVDQIAGKADIARKTLYNHFPVKEAIVNAYVGEQSMAMAKTVLERLDQYPDTACRLMAALDAGYTWVETNPEFTGIALGYRMKNMLQNSETKEKETGTQMLLTRIICLGQKAKEIRADIPVNQLVLQIDVMRSAVVMDWLRDKHNFDLHSQIARIVDLFLNGAAGKKEVN